MPPISNNTVSSTANNLSSMVNKPNRSRKAGLPLNTARIRVTMEEADLSRDRASMGSTEGKEDIMAREDMAVRAEWKVKAAMANTISSECAIFERALTV